MSFAFVMWGLTLQHRSKWRERNRSEEAKRSPLSPNLDLSEVDQKIRRQQRSEGRSVTVTTTLALRVNP